MLNDIVMGLKLYWDSLVNMFKEPKAEVTLETRTFTPKPEVAPVMVKNESPKQEVKAEKKTNKSNKGGTSRKKKKSE